MNDIQYLLDYIEKYGNYGFREKSFNEVDGIIFSQLSYIDFKNIVNKKIFLSNASIKFSSLYTEEQTDELLGISQKAIKLMHACAKTKRFGWCELSQYINNINGAIDKQFSAINFHLDDGTLVVSFRGTDATITGIKESAMLSYMFPVPAQIHALHYFQETAMLGDGDVICVGHSKGGNLAVFAGVNCSNSLKKKIVGIYEYDAPGFPKWFFDRYDYKEIKDRCFLYTPQGSIVGRMLEHDEKPIIVNSINSGLKQHQVSSWIVDDDHFERVEKYDMSSDLTAEYINTLIDYVGDEDLEVFYDMLGYLFVNMGVEDFYDLKKFDIKKAISLIDTITTVSDEQKERFKTILKKASSDFAKAFVTDKTKYLIDKYIPKELRQ